MKLIDVGGNRERVCVIINVSVYVVQRKTEREREKERERERERKKERQREKKRENKVNIRGRKMRKSMCKN